MWDELVSDGDTLSFSFSEMNIDGGGHRWSGRVQFEFKHEAETSRKKEENILLFLFLLFIYHFPPCFCSSIFSPHYSFLYFYPFSLFLSCFPSPPKTIPHLPPSCFSLTHLSPSSYLLLLFLLLLFIFLSCLSSLPPPSFFLMISSSS